MDHLTLAQYGQIGMLVFVLAVIAVVMLVRREVRRDDAADKLKAGGQQDLTGGPKEPA